MGGHGYMPTWKVKCFRLGSDALKLAAKPLNSGFLVNKGSAKTSIVYLLFTSRTLADHYYRRFTCSTNDFIKLH